MSYNAFNYNHRPSKSIERKMIVELFREIFGVSNAKHYSYIGLGSIFFTDFKLLHKELGIKNLINIEMNEDDVERFIFNKPYYSIDLKWGMTTDVLPQLDWLKKYLIWLDYTASLQPFMFQDIETIFSNIISGGFYLMSCNSTFTKFKDKKTGLPSVEKFQEVFSEYTPFEISPEDLTNANAPSLIKRMMEARIRHILNLRNAALPEADQLIFHQLLFIIYQDGAPMITFGGIILANRDFDKFLNKSIFELPYVALGNDFLNIETPILTNPEIDLLNNFLPNSKKRFLNYKKLNFIPAENKSQYFDIYRYYPNYVEIRDL